MAKTKISPTGLPDLPPELVELIILLGPVESLYNLRLTCRDLHAKADYVFLYHHFFERRFYITSPTSMALLVNISATERMAKALDRIRFSLAKMKPRSEHDYRSHCYRWSRTDFSRESRIDHRDNRRTWQLLSQKHKKYIKGTPSPLQRDLVQIFRNFMHHGCTPGIVATDSDCDFYSKGSLIHSPLDPKWPRPEVDYENIMNDESDDKRPVEILWRAIIESQYPFNTSKLDR